MNITKHARVRSQQRGISEEIIMLLLLLGEPRGKPGNAMEYRIGKKLKGDIVGKLKKLIQLLDKIDNKAAIVDGEDIITVYNV
jgi:hypothetical protein